MYKILIADDEESMTEWLEIAFKRERYGVLTANSGRAALDILNRTIVDLVVCDIMMPDMTGVEVLKECKRLSPETIFILITAYASSETAIEALQHGAYDYITKPFNLDELKNIIKHALEKKSLKQELALLKREIIKENTLIGRSPRMVEIYKLIGTIAATDSTVLIEGESGTGKELVARAIHQASPRRDKPFVSINCSAFPETLLESELFGYVKGAFTGADSNKKGLFEVADRGTLFLDEIGEMTPQIQVKLLRVLQEKKFRRLGSTEEIPIDVRIVAATNRDLKQALESGGFREDLYYRLAVIPIRVPPLRERREDLPLLVNHFLQKYSQKLGKGITRVSDEAFRYIETYDWPGNVRELENVIERAVTLEITSEVQPERLPEQVRGIREQRADERTLPANGIDLESYLREQERRFLLQALQRSSWNQVEAAKLLRLSYRSLRHKLKIHNLRRSQELEGGARS